jgi:hypothetical protein
VTDVELDPALSLTLRLCLGLLFATAASHKLRDPHAFRDTLERYELLPAAFVGPVGVALMGGELVIAFTVLFLHVACIAGAAVLALYTVAIALNLARGRTDLGCGCMGPAASAPISGWLVLRNVVLLAAAVVASFPASSRALSWVDALTIAAATGSLVALWLAGEKMLALAPMLDRLRSPTP